MQKILATVFVSCSVLFSSQAFCQNDGGFKPGGYGSIGLMQAYYKENAFNFNNSMAALNLGYQINPNFAVEGVAAAAVNNANFYVGSTSITAKVGSAYGAYAKIILPATENFAFFARLGATHGNASASSRYGSAWAGGTSSSFGVGAQFNLTKDMFGQVDYMSYYRNADVSVSGPSVSIGARF